MYKGTYRYRCSSFIASSSRIVSAISSNSLVTWRYLKVFLYFYSMIRFGGRIIAKPSIRPACPRAVYLKCHDRYCYESYSRFVYSRLPCSTDGFDCFCWCSFYPAWWVKHSGCAHLLQLILDQLGSWQQKHTKTKSTLLSTNIRHDI